jgi:predicted NAD/FAD-binding protein
LDIAIVGTGIAGLATAWLLNDRHRVTVYEALPRAGGHSHTVDVTAGGRSLAVDTGFIVYNEVNYPELTRLFATLKVATQPSDMSFAVSVAGGAFEYSGAWDGILAQRRNLLRPSFHRMIWDILRFNRAGARFLAARQDRHELTLGEFLRTGRYGRRFRDAYLLPMAGAIWSAPTAEIMAFPCLSFLRFFANHGLLSVDGHHHWRTVSGGAREYVRRLTAPLGPRLRLGCPVSSVRRSDLGVHLTTADGQSRRYDRVVLACHGDQAARLLIDADPAERRTLGAFRFQPNRAILHGDASLMPRRRQAWAAWNYLTDRLGPSTAGISVTYWMNRLQSLDPSVPLFLSVNPGREPDPATVHGAWTYDHPVLDHAALRAQQQLPAIQGRGGVHYAGAWLGYGFHEDGLRSALSVAERGFGVLPPWRATPLPARRGDSAIAFPDRAAASPL